MTEEFWVNTHFSVARYTGRVSVDGHVYVIVNKEGKDIFQLSIEAERAGRQKAIEPGEPADLCRIDFVPFYRKLGREEFMRVLKDNPNTEEKELKRLFKEMTKKK
jgi:hypothetical protein